MKSTSSLCPKCGNSRKLHGESFVCRYCKQLIASAIKEKYCRRCNSVKPRNEWGFQAASADGLKDRCKGCWLIYLKSYRAQRKLLGFVRVRNITPEAKEKKAEYDRNYHRANHEKTKARLDIAKERDPDRFSAYTRKSRQKDLSKSRARDIADHHKRKSLKISNGGSYTLEEWSTLCNKYENRCLCCGIEGHLTKLGKLTVDHVVPIIKGGSNGVENLQPLCRHCNNKKAVKDTDYRPKKF